MTTIVDRIKSMTEVDVNHIQLPKSVRLELSAVCNHKCNYCVVPTLKVPTKFMSKDVFCKCLEEIMRLNIQEIGISHMGEATLHPKFKELINLIPTDIKTFITTNGTNLDALKYLVEKNINSIKFSLNGYSRETHKKIIGVDTFDTVINNLKELIQYRNEIKSSTQISASSICYEIDEQDKFVNDVKKIVDCFYYTQLFNHAGKVNNSPIKYKKYNYLDNLCRLPCYGLYNMCHIKSNGDINICRWGVDSEFVIGNILNDKLDDVWFSDKANKLREESSNRCNNTCNKCVEIVNKSKDWRELRKLSYLMNEWDDVNLPQSEDYSNIVQQTIDFFKNGSELIQPAKSYFVAIVYAKCLEKYFGEEFYTALNYKDLLPDDKWFKPYSESKEIYDAILNEIGDVFSYISIDKTVSYFKKEFLIV